MTKKKKTHHGRVRRRLTTLFRQRVFWVITLFGNSLVLLGSLLFHYFEVGKNPGVDSILDSLLVGMGLVTTTGFGSITPVTPGGKVVCIAMMMGGALFIWTYMALFVSALIAPDLSYLEREVVEIETDLTEIRKGIRHENHGV